MHADPRKCTRCGYFFEYVNGRILKEGYVCWICLEKDGITCLPYGPRR